MSMNDYLGTVNSYNIGISPYAGNYWGLVILEPNQPELWPGMGTYYNNKERYEQTWQGYSGGEATGVRSGASVSYRITKHLKWINKLLILKG